jgi:AraC-like DNA-binding protein
MPSQANSSNDKGMDNPTRSCIFLPQNISATEKRLPFLDLPSAITTKDSQSYANVINRVLRLRDCAGIIERNSFRSTSNVVPLGDIFLLATFGPGVIAEGKSPGASCFMLPYVTEGHYYVDGKTFPNYYQGSVLHMPPISWKLEIKSSHIIGVTTLVPPQLLLRTAAAMQGEGLDSSGLAGMLQRPALLRTDTEYGRAILENLYKFMDFVESVLYSNELVPKILRLDDLLIRQLLMLMLPPKEERASCLNDGRSFNELLEWIKAHCHLNISLTDLEERSLYSRRSLQRAFQQRFGCGPMQWVRQQRMELARHKLERAPLNQSVWNVGLDCGYINFSAFSRDYRRTFGVSPSRHLGLLSRPGN